jgi:hypothetical protein
MRKDLTNRPREISNNTNNLWIMIWVSQEINQKPNRDWSRSRHLQQRRKSPMSLSSMCYGITWFTARRPVNLSLIWTILKECAISFGSDRVFPMGLIERIGENIDQSWSAWIHILPFYERTGKIGRRICLAELIYLGMWNFRRWRLSGPPCPRGDCRGSSARSHGFVEIWELKILPSSNHEPEKDEWS